MKFFIEIGSSDFDTLIPLAKQGWHGIIVEPIKYYLDRIERVPGVIYENAAITPQEGTFQIKRWDPEFINSQGQFWMHGSGNLNLKYNVFEANKKLKDHEIVEDVKGITLDQLLDKHKVSQIDYLKIDTEGYDSLILESYDFRIKPTVIRAEHVHCGADRITEILESQGYLVYKEPNDVYAVG